jgi:hypothetical protein
LLVESHRARDLRCRRFRDAVPRVTANATNWATPICDLTFDVRLGIHTDRLGPAVRLEGEERASRRSLCASAGTSISAQKRVRSST